MNIAQAIDPEANHDDSPTDQPDDNTLDKIANGIIVDKQKPFPYSNSNFNSLSKSAAHSL